MTLTWRHGDARVFFTSNTSNAHGELRLKAARLRRAGKVTDSFVLLAGPLVLVQTIIKVPDVYQRQRIIAQVSRMLSAGKRAAS